MIVSVMVFFFYGILRGYQKLIKFVKIEVLSFKRNYVQQDCK